MIWSVSGETERILRRRSWKSRSTCFHFHKEKEKYPLDHSGGEAGSVLPPENYLICSVFGSE